MTSRNKPTPGRSIWPGARPWTTLCSLTLLAAALVVIPDTIRSSADALSSGVTFGAYAEPVNGQSNIQATQQLEQQLGTTLPMIRAFGNWDGAIGADKPLHTWARDGGRQVMVSVKPKHNNGSIIAWRDIADAAPGSALWNDMAGLADGARRFGEPMIVSFHHEPEAGRNAVYGNNEDFKAAFRKFVEVFRAEGATNVSFAWTMTHWAFEVGDSRPTDPRRAEIWYPGDDVVDFIAGDPYNWNNCRGTGTEPWRSLEDTIEPMMRFGRQHPEKKLILAEFGSDEGNTGQKAAWLDEAARMLKSGEHRDKIAAVLYFHDDGADDGVPNCDWWLDSSTSALAAATRIASDSYFRARVPLGNTTPPPPRPTTTTTAAPTPGPTTPTPAPAPRPSIQCFGERATITGTNGGDILHGTPGRDVIVGLGGDDQIFGADGDDLICAGPGRDTVWGNNGNDRIAGDAARDRLHGGAGRDRIWGGRGRDIIRGNSGRDRLDGGPGDDTVNGGIGERDICFGRHGEDRLGATCESSHN